MDSHPSLFLIPLLNLARYRVLTLARYHVLILA